MERARILFLRTHLMDRPNDSLDSDATRATTPSRLAGRQAPYAFLGHPAVQLLRFLTKAGVVWFLTREELGAALFAGLFVFLGQHAALLGMDDTVIHAPRLSARLWRRVSRFTHWTGAGLALLVALAGQLLGLWRGEPELGLLTAVLAPTVWIGNWGALPTALLLRERSFRAVFYIDLIGVVAFALTTLLSAALGAGPWSFVAGWYANALLSLLVARHLARGPIESLATVDTELEEETQAFRYGVQVSGASLLSVGGQRGDGLAVSLFLGSALFGLYEWSLHLALFGMGYLASLAERFLFPVLAEESRSHGSEGVRLARAEALRTTAYVVLPLYVLLAAFARPLLEHLFPAEWHAAAPLVSIFALSAAAQSFAIVADTTLKALGRSSVVLRLSFLRLVILVLALAVVLPSGEIERIALGVLVARTLGAIASIIICLRDDAALPALPKEGAA